MDMDFQNPRHFAIMALHMVDLPIEDIPDDFLSSATDSGFDLSFGLEQAQTLMLSWDEGTRHWHICAQVTPNIAQSQWSTMLLELSQILPEELRLHTESGSLNVCTQLDHEDLTLDSLAMGIVDVLAWLKRLDDAINALPTAIEPMPSEVPLQAWAIRG